MHCWRTSWCDPRRVCVYMCVRVCTRAQQPWPRTQRVLLSSLCLVVHCCAVAAVQRHDARCCAIYDECIRRCYKK